MCVLVVVLVVLLTMFPFLRLIACYSGEMYDNEKGGKEKKSANGCIILTG